MSQDRNEQYALKRFFFENPEEPLYFALKEFHILRKIALDSSASPFLPTLCYSFVIQYSPVLVTEEASGINLYNVVFSSSPLKRLEAKRCMTEITSGLKYLHEIGIVHMELRPANILISKSGHILISDFDRSYDLTIRHRPEPSYLDYLVTQRYAAPEVANGYLISTKADVWSLGVVTARLFGKTIREDNLDQYTEMSLSRKGYWIRENFTDLPEDLLEFFDKVFTLNPYERPSIEDVQNLRLFNQINWSYVERKKYPPPFTETRLLQIARESAPDFNPENPTLLNCLYSDSMPVKRDGHIQIAKNEHGVEKVALIQPYLLRLGAPTRKIADINSKLANFKFIHPRLFYRRLLQSD